MNKVVLDTNVIVSGTFWAGSSSKIFDIIDKKMLILILSEEILKEYERVIKSEEIMEKVENHNLIISKIVQRVIANSEIIEPKEKYKIIKDDSDDNKFLDCAVAGKANFIISQDKHLLTLKEFKSIKIVTPKEFLEFKS